MKLVKGKYVLDYTDEKGNTHNLVIPKHVNPIVVSRLAVIADEYMTDYNIPRGVINDNTK